MRRLTTILYTIALVGLLASPAMAQLFKDDFTGPVGDTLGAHGYVWLSSNVNLISIVSPGLEYGTYAGSGIGNAAGLKNNGEDVCAVFKADSVRTGNIYAAFLVNVSAAQTGDYFFSFLPSPKSSNYAMRVFLKSDGAGGFFMGVTKGSETPQVYGTTHFSFNTTYLMVAKYTFVPADSTDLCTLYAFSGGDVPESEPAIAEVGPYNGSAKPDAVGLSTFALRQGSASSAATLTFDGVRIDTTWARALGFVPVPEFSVAPSVQQFGKVWVDSTKTDSLTVTNISRKASLVIDSVKSSNAKFVVAPTDATVDTMQSVKFAVTYHPTVLGADTGLVVFYHNAQSRQDTVVVIGTGAEKAAALVLESHVASFGRVVVGGSKTDSVKIKNTGELTLHVGSVTSKDAASFGVSLGSTSVPAGDSTYVKVTFHPVAVGAKADTIVFASDAPEGVDTLFVDGTSAEPAATFLLSPKTVAFPGIRAGQQLTDTVKIKNGGELTLTISGFTQTDTTFHVVMESDSVKAGDSTRVFVRFAPTASGTYRDTVVFTSNAAEVKDTLSLQGIASDIISIAAARALPNGTEVIVRGIVTRVMGSYTFIQDTTGGMIMYSNAAGAPAHDSVASGYIKPGDLLEIDGLTSEYRALKEIATSGILSFLRISRGNPVPAPQVVTLAEIVAHGEDYEAELIQVKKLSFSSASGTFTNALSYNIVDSSDASNAVVLRVQGATDTELGGLPIPTGTFTFTGVLGQFSSSATGGYQLLPVDTTDVLVDPTDGIASMPAGVPAVFELAQNFPNPFNPTTTIQYALPVESRVTVTIYSVLGQAIRTLVSETQKASYYRVVWDGLNEAKAPVATGIYFYRISAEPATKDGTPFVQVKKMLMLK